MKRVVITGIGIISSIGNNKKEVLSSLQNAKSGITIDTEYANLGFRSRVSGAIKNIDYKNLIDKKIVRFMGQAAGYAYLAMQEAIADAGLTQDLISHHKTGLIVGSGGASNSDVVESADLLRNGGIKKLGPYRVTRAMGSTTSACLATAFKVKGTAYSISSACATSAHCIGSALEQIQMGKQTVMFAGGGEELHWSLSMLFDAMGSLSSNNNTTPELASRAFDVNADGFVISGGAGIVVLEDLEHAIQRKANIYAEIVGYGNSSDGNNMVQPSQEGAVRCMQNALATVTDKIDYVNAHGTSTPVGDPKELNALHEVFSDYKPAISSTKSLTGHSLGAAGVHEAIYSLLMLQNNFIAPSINIQDLIAEAAGHNIIREKNKISINTALSNSFGFGGVNASLVFKRY
jgi:3-oxoacyl-[acyl-carrier-protein] synthase-1